MKTGQGELVLLVLGFVDALLDALCAAMTTAIKFLLAFDFFMSHGALLMEFFMMEQHTVPHAISFP